MSPALALAFASLLAAAPNHLTDSVPQVVAAQDRDPLHTDLQQFLDSLHLAVTTGRRSELVEYVDVDAMLDRILDLLDEQLRARATEPPARRGLQAGLSIAIPDLVATFGARSFEVLRFERSAAGRRATLVARTRNEYGTIERMRVWVTRTAGRWRMCDFEEVAVAVPASAYMASHLAALVGGADARWTAALSKLLAVGHQYGGDELLEELDSALAECALVEFPPRVDPLRRMLHASTRLGQMRFDEAAAALETLDATEMPIVDWFWAVLLNLRGEHAVALDRARSYIAAVGDDPDGRLEEGRALAALDRPDQALAAYALGLGEDPGNFELLVELGALEVDGAVEELARRFAAAPAPLDLFEDLVVELLERERIESAEVLVAGLRALAREDPNADYYGAELLSRAGRHAEAAEMLRGTLERVKESDEYEAYAYAYAVQCVLSGAALDAYAALEDPDLALEWLAELLEDAGDEAGLHALADEHERHAPADARVPWLRGRAFLLGGDRESAEAALAAAMAGELDQWDLNSVRLARVSNLYAAGRWRDAYERVPPPIDTFKDLALWMAEDGEVEPLAELVAAHRASGADPVASWLAWFDAEILWLRGDYRGALVHLRAKRVEIVRAEVGEGEDLWRIYRWEDRVFRSLARLGRLEEATGLALTIDARDDDPQYVAIAHATAGRYEEAGAALTRLVERGWRAVDLYGDADLGPALRADAAASLRAIVPPPE